MLNTWLLWLNGAWINVFTRVRHGAGSYTTIALLLHLQFIFALALIFLFDIFKYVYIVSFFVLELHVHNNVPPWGTHISITAWCSLGSGLSFATQENQTTTFNKIGIAVGRWCECNEKMCGKVKRINISLLKRAWWNYLKRYVLTWC